MIHILDCIRRETASFMDGPAMQDPRKRRENMLFAMSADLVAFNAFSNRDDAFLTLRVQGFSEFDIRALGPEAMAMAAQDAVAREMGATTTI